MLNSSRKRSPITAGVNSTTVGCYLANDRRFAAKFVESSLSRFCHLKKEPIERLANHCTDADLVSDKLNKLDNLGPNFLKLGIVEVPDSIVQSRLKTSPIFGFPVVLWTYGMIQLTFGRVPAFANLKVPGMPPLVFLL